MSRRLGAKAALFAFALLSLAALVPIAEADHAYSHRYLVFGRVVDANNNPVPNLRVDLGYEPPFSPEGPCANQPETETDAFGPSRTTPVTNQFGEFIFCFHTHRMSSTLPGEAIVRIEDRNVERRFELDPYTRHSFVAIKLDDAHPAANTTILSQQYTIQGTVWQPAAGRDLFVDSVKVFGITIDQSPVNITFEYNGKEPVQLSTSTNNYGDFAVRVPVTERPTSGRITIEVHNRTFTANVDPTFGTTQITAEFPEPETNTMRNLLIGLGAVVVIGGGGTALWVGSRKMRAAREEREARAGSQRRRANK